MLSRFHTIPACYGPRDRKRLRKLLLGRTDRIAISISSVSVLTRDKNETGKSSGKMPDCGVWDPNPIKFS